MACHFYFTLCSVYIPPSNASKIAKCSNMELIADGYAAVYARFCYSFPMSDTRSLADEINRLATALTADADFIPFQRRVVAALDQIEAILDRGVPLRRLADALSKAGLLDGLAQPMSESHFRAAVSRARSRRRQKNTQAATSAGNTPDRPGPSPLGGQTVLPSAAADFFARQEATRQQAAEQDAKRPDFSGGLFEPSSRTAQRPPPKR